MLIRFCYANLHQYASKNLERNALFALAIPYPLLLQWHRTLSEKISQKISELVDYTFLLEVSIKGNVLSFTDDKAKRHEINKHLAKIAGTAAAVYWKTTGRAKKQLENNVKKFHVFEDQLKSWQSVGSEVKTMATEIEEWKLKYNNIGKEKEALFNGMTKIVLEKDVVIGQLQKTNSELKQYHGYQS